MILVDILPTIIVECRVSAYVLMYLLVKFLTLDETNKKFCRSVLLATANSVKYGILADDIRIMVKSNNGHNCQPKRHPHATHY